MTRRPAPVLLLALLVAALVGGCSAGTYAPTAMPAPSSTPPSPAAAPSPSTSAPACGNPLASYAPPATLPAPGDWPSTSTMARIRQRGRLVVGVSADSLLLGARNPLTGTIEGFDIDMARLVAEAIFGDPDRIELKVITAAQRIPALQDNTVDLVARNMTITCARWQQIAFSAEYYRSGQKLLVPRGSAARTLDDLAGKRVCAPSGSTSLDLLEQHRDVVAVPADTHTGCLVKFQQGTVDAITGDDTVLAGLAAQDPYAQVVGRAFTAEPYGLGMNSRNVDLVRFVNAVLARAKADGRWKQAYDRWLARALGPAPAPPTPVYGR